MLRSYLPIYFYLKGRDRKRERARQREILLLNRSFPKCLEQLGLGYTEVRKLELSPGFSCWLQEPYCLSHPLLPPKVFGSEMVELEAPVVLQTL